MNFQFVDIRQIDANEFTPLLEAESRAWREGLRWDFAASAKMIAACLREKRLSGCALVTDEAIRGYCFSFADGEKGFIGDLFVESGPTQISRAQKLLDQVIEKLISTPGLRRIEAQLPHFMLEQLEPSFHSRCFKSYGRRFMAVSLENRPARPILQGPPRTGNPQRNRFPSGDFLFEPWERQFDQKAAELLCRVYRNHVDTAINDQYSSVEGTSRLIENIVQHQGCGEFLPSASLVAMHRTTNDFAGFVGLTAVGPRNAHIPQIAVASQFQGAGLGTALLESSFRELVGRGFREVTLTVTDLNAGAVRLYERLGFETFRTFGAFVWERAERSSLLTTPALP